MVQKKKKTNPTKNSNQIVENGAFQIEPQERLALEEIFSILRKKSGVDFSHYRDTTVLRRLSRRMISCKEHSYTNYLNYLTNNPKEIDLLYEDLLLSFTHFFRDPLVFETLKEKVFPVLLKDSTAKSPVRIWVPGCSTGEEVYSMAICIYEFMDQHNLKVPVQFFGTDLVDHHVEIARSGLYSDKIRKFVSPGRLERFFDSTPVGLKVIKHIREMCVFAVQDIIQDPPFPNIDLISCRNVLIYFDLDLQETTIPHFHFSLNTDGFLLLGSSETMSRFPHYFNPLDHRINLYTKRISGNRPDYRFAFHKNTNNIKDLSIIKPKPTPSRVEPAEFQNTIKDVLIKTYSPPGILIDGNLQIRQFFGQTFPILGPLSGKASLKLSKMASSALMPDLYVAIEDARKNERRVVKKNVAFGKAGYAEVINLSVTPVFDQNTSETNFLIMFEEPETKQHVELRPQVTIENGDDETKKLRLELLSIKEHLQSIIEEKDTVNQELCSSNEEVLSTNEELQSVNEEMEAAKEELESGNEELIALNDEMHSKNVQLNTARTFAENLVDSANTIVVALNIDAEITVFNKFAEKLTGYKNEEVLNKNWYSIFIPNRDPSNLPKAFLDRLKDGRIQSDYKNSILCKNGKKRLIAWSNSLLKDDLGSITGLLCIGIDISTRAQADEAQKVHVEFLKNLDRINKIISGSTDFEEMMNSVLTEVLSIFNCDRAWLLNPCDPDAASWTIPVMCTAPGFESNEVMNVAVPIHEDDRTTLRAALETDNPVGFGELNELQIQPYLILEHAVKSQLVFAIHPKMGAPWAIGLHSCSEARKWTTAERDLLKEIGHRFCDAISSMLFLRDLVESEGRYINIVEGLLVGIAIHVDNKIVFVNDAAIKLLGYESEDDFMGKNVLEFVHPDEYEFVLQTIEYGLSDDSNISADAPRYIEERLIRADGSIATVDASAIVINYYGKKALMVMLSDISERKQAEKALLEESTYLESLINNTPGAVAVLDPDSNIVRVNQNFTSFFGFTEIEAKGRNIHDLIVPKGLEDIPVKLKSLKEIKANKGKLFRTTRQNKNGDLLNVEIMGSDVTVEGKFLGTYAIYLDISPRIKAEKERQAINLQSLIKESLKLLRPSFPATIEIQQCIEPLCGKVYADATQMHQIIVNLCTNAWQAMEHKGGILRIELRQKPVSPRIAKLYPRLIEADYICFSVIDSGPGIAIDLKDRIFEPFFTTKDVNKGTGLGLSVVHGIVHSHDGEIVVSSQKGKGTTFDVYLPLADGQKQAEEEPAPVIEGGTEHIMVVDDENTIADMVKRMLEKFGYQVNVFNSGLDALKAFKQTPNKYDLLISDLTMPQMTGLDLADILHQRDPDFPIVLMTGFGDNVTPASQNRYGISHVISKPIIKRLMSVVREVLKSSD
jgi:PAS domain S-box-containing protein